MSEQDEVLIEVEAVEAVYGGDCTVLNSFPPHLHLHIKPRTADISSQQFVEAVIGIRTGVQYPKEPPCIELIDCKGLDRERKKYLIDRITDKAHELSSCSMLVAICEEAIETLSSMNHPEGDCPMCLYPLLQEDKHGEIVSFMKLMSCFHCFHSECIIRWWNWLQTERQAHAKDSSRAVKYPKGIEDAINENMGSCPVCRMVFHTKDFEHVLDLVGSHSSHLSSSETEAVEDDKLLHSDTENSRRKKFEETLKLQQENSGLIEPKKDLLVLPGMFLPQPVGSTATTESVTSSTTTAATNESVTSSTTTAATNESVTPTATEETGKSEQRKPESECSGSSTKPHNSKHRHRHRQPHPMRRQSVQNSKQAAKQWLRKDINDT